MISTKGLKRLEDGILITHDESSGTTRLDHTSEGILVSTFEENQQHKGKHFFIKGYVDFTATQATTKYFMFDTPDSDTRIHAKAMISTTDIFVIEIYEDADITASGIPVQGFNNDRDSDIESELKAYANPEVQNEGNLIWPAKTTTVNVAPLVNYEIIAKTDSTYLWKLSKISQGKQTIDYDFFWSEHVPKDKR